MKTLTQFMAAAAMMLTVAACSSATDKSQATATDTTAADPTGIEAVEAMPDTAAVEVKDVVKVIAPDEMIPAKPEKTMIVDFWATWCGPCKQFAPVFHKVAAKYADKIVFASADVDQCRALAEKYKVASIPFTLAVRPDGTTLSNLGYMDEQEFTAFVEKVLNP